MISAVFVLLLAATSALAKEQFQLFVGVDGQFYFRLMGGNHEIVLQSEGYSSRSAARGGVDAVRKATVYEKSDDHFVVKGDNGEIVGKSEEYESGQLDRGIADVKAILAKTPELRDLAPSDSVGRFELFKGVDDQFYFRLRAANYEIVLQSEGYTRRSNALNGIDSVIKNAATYANFEQKTSADNKYYFVLKSEDNGQTIGVSETYNTEGARANGIYSVQFNAAQAETVEVVDLSYPDDKAAEVADDGPEVSVSESFGSYVVQVPTNSYITDPADDGYGGALTWWYNELEEAQTRAASEATSRNGRVVDETTNNARRSRFVIFCSKGKPGVYFHLKASNGEIILQSEHYTTEQAAKKGVASVQENGAEEAQFKRLESRNNKPYFTLIAKNYQVIGVSEMYESTGGRDNGIASVQRSVANAVIVDQTNEMNNCRAPKYPPGFEFGYVGGEARMDGDMEESGVESLSLALSAIAAVVVAVI